MEVEVPLVDECCGDDAGVIWVGAADGDSPSAKVDVVGGGISICAGEDNYYITVVGIVDSGLDIVKIRRAIVVNGDCPCPTGGRQGQVDG